MPIPSDGIGIFVIKNMQNAKNVSIELGV